MRASEARLAKRCPNGGEDAVRGGKKRSTGRIEVVAVLMMGKQHDIDPVLLGDVECRPCQLGEAAVLAGRGERGIR
jgi:hypothetical protein